MRALALCLLALFSAPVFADIHQIQPGDDSCTIIGKISATIMQGRQQGTPLSTLLEISERADEKDRKLFRLIIMEAYDRPAFHSEAYRARAAMDFRNEIHLLCLKEREG